MSVFNDERDTSPNEGAHLLAWQHAAEFEQQQRWGSHRPDSLAVHEHLELFGVDADNLRHGLLQRRIGSSMAHQLELDEATTEFIKILELYHDLGECRAAGSKKGDVSWLLKSDSEESEEMSDLERILWDDPHFSDLSDELLEKIFAVMEDAKSENPKTFEGAFFDASERVGYLRTQLVVFRKMPIEWQSRIDAPSDSPLLGDLPVEERLDLQHMQMEVIGRHIHDLHQRHLAVGSGFDNLDQLIGNMLVKYAPELYDAISHLDNEERIRGYQVFSYDRFFRKAQSDGIENPDEVARERAVAAVEYFRTSVAILADFSQTG